MGYQSELQSLFLQSQSFRIQESSGNDDTITTRCVHVHMCYSWCLLDIEKVALVFGNTNYKREDLNLLTAGNDAAAIANKLKSFGWRGRY